MKDNISIHSHRKTGLILLEKAAKALAKNEADGVRVLFSVHSGYGYYCVKKSGKKPAKSYLAALKKEMKAISKKENSIKEFDIEPFDDGFILWFPVNGVKSVTITPNLFSVLKRTVAWTDKINISSLFELNEVIYKGGIRDIILMQEAKTEARLAKMARSILEMEGCKFIMIAGPSSSGKTTFSHRLSIQLRTMGLIPHPIPLDDYYLDRDKVPLDEFGEKDFETVKSLDIERFNSDMQSLLKGRATELPIFNFKTGMRAETGRTLKLNKDDVLVIEGINGLNDELSYSLPTQSKFKIYISALNTLSIDDYHPMSTSDTRLMRRIIRDARVRNTPAAGTLAMWPSVRRGEDKNIFPFQEEADEMFNSAYVYEMAVLKLYAEPLLTSIKKGEKEYGEARRLLELLKGAFPMPTEDIPNNSLMREFIGGGCFGV